MKLNKVLPCTVLLSVMILSAIGCRANPRSNRYFTIEVIDDQTGRGVPLVELRTVNNIRYYTDSGGVVAFYEPGLMNRDVFFYVKSHGYELPPDRAFIKAVCQKHNMEVPPDEQLGDFLHGTMLRTTSSGIARLQNHRQNIAERLYRITGAGIYRDTLLVGRKAPIKRPLLNGRVLGQDTVMATPYRGKIYWFWGDTNCESYPVGHFATSGATSELPGKGGLDPSMGIDLTYFVDEAGFSKPMVLLGGPGMLWIDAVLTVKDGSGRERLVAHYRRMASLGEKLEHGLVVFNDRSQVFERLVQFDLDARLGPAGQPLRVTVAGESYYYFAEPYPFIRVKANWEDLMEPALYESWTCLAPGAGYEKDSPALERGADGRLIWGWKRDTAVVDVDRQRELIAGGKMEAKEAWIDLRDVESGESVNGKRGSVRWNGFRKRYVMIVQQIEGTSYLGEIWYSEADAPEGPWLWARKVVTHDRYSFYNPVHHAFFDQDGGRIIYFEATYTNSFSATEVPTPRYNYNQIMYRLDLSDPRLALPRSKADSEE